MKFVDHDHDFNALNPNLAFVAEGRIGNNALNGTHELNFHGINPLNETATSGEANFVWTNGQATDFSLTYDAVTRNITYAVGNVLLQSTANQTPVTDIFIRTRATMAGTNMLISNLFLNGKAVNQQVGVTGGGSWESGMEYLRISGFGDSFTLTGQSTMTWGQTRPNNSHLAYQIKVGTADGAVEVPEPMTMTGLLVGAGGLMAARRRRRPSH